MAINYIWLKNGSKDRMIGRVNMNKKTSTGHEARIEDVYSPYEGPHDPFSRYIQDVPSSRRRPSTGRHCLSDGFDDDVALCERGACARSRRRARKKYFSTSRALAVARGGRARAPVDAMDLGRGRGGDLGFLGGGRARGTPDVRARAVGTSEGVETVFRDGCDRSDSCAMTDERAFVRVFST